MNIFAKIIFAARIGLSDSLGILHASLLRTWQEWRYRKPSPTSYPPVSPGQLIDSHSQPDGARYTFERAELEVRFLASDLARLSWEPGLPPIPYALVENEWSPPPLTRRQLPEGHALGSESLEVIVQPNGGVILRNANGETLRQDSPPLRRGGSWTLLSQLHPQEQLHGLGERAAALNLPLGQYLLANRDPGGSYLPGTDPLYISIPLYVGRHPCGSYLVFYENPHQGDFWIDGQADRSAKTCRISFSDGMMRYYFIPGPLPRALERYTQLTGRPPLPPRWALGYHQSRWGYKNENDVRAVLAGFQEHDLPLSALHLDIDYMDGYRVFTVDANSFPDLPSLVKDFSAQGVRLVTILDPGVKRDPDYSLYQEGLKRDVFCKLPSGETLQARVWPGWCAFPDFTHPQVRDWWGEHYPQLLDAGVSGFWHDMNEPSAFVAWGEPTLPQSTHYNLEGRGGDHREANNIYGLLMNRSGFEALRSLQPERRPWILSRSGWAGMQRYAWSWTGDTESTWRILRQTVPTALGLSLSGIPYTGPDIGGFRGDPSAELFLRWFQLATFLPFFRGHAEMSTKQREPWLFGEPYTSIIRRFLKLRCCLIPYLYTLAWEASQSGHPLVRPLFWAAEDGPNLSDVQDSFTLGDALLVAPVMEQGSRKREVILPPGGWIHFWDEKSYQGPLRLALEAPLERIPLLVRAGTVLPMEKQNTLHLHIYPPIKTALRPEVTSRSSSDLYSDSGDGYGEWRLDRFDLHWEGDILVLHREDRGDYPFPYKEIILNLHAAKAGTVWLDGKDHLTVQNRVKTPLFQEARFKIESQT